MVTDTARRFETERVGYVYCRHCGAELKDGARFCAGCGAEVAAESAAIEAAPAANETGASFGEAVDRGKRRSMRKMSPLLAIALTLALAAGTAFAAYYVYTEVIEPASHETETAGLSDVEENPEETYGYTMESMEVQFTSRDVCKWPYPHFTTSGDTTGVDRVNELIENDLQKNSEFVISYGSGRTYPAVEFVGYTVEYLSESIVSVRRRELFRGGFGVESYRLSGWDNQGYFVTGLTFDLATGEQIDPVEYMGIEEGDLPELVGECVEKAVAESPDEDAPFTLKTQDIDMLKKTALEDPFDTAAYLREVSGMDHSNMYLSNGGLVVIPMNLCSVDTNFNDGIIETAGWMRPYEFYIAAFDDESLVGTIYRSNDSPAEMRADAKRG